MAIPDDDETAREVRRDGAVPLYCTSLDRRELYGWLAQVQQQYAGYRMRQDVFELPDLDDPSRVRGHMMIVTLLPPLDDAQREAAEWRRRFQAAERERARLINAARALRRELEQIEADAGRPVGAGPAH